MLKIGDFSRLSHLTVKALRFYEKEKLLIPASVDEWTGYRFYILTFSIVFYAEKAAFGKSGHSIVNIF